MMDNKGFLYVGYYRDTEDNYILKVGTTNDLNRRRKEHTRSYRKAKQYTLPPGAEFEYLWKLKLSKYNTLRYEDRTKDTWKQMEIGQFLRNDRFILSTIPETVPIKIRKTYEVKLL